MRGIFFALLSDNIGMRQNLEKIAVIAQVLIGIIFVLFVMLIPFGVLEAGIFDNSLVRILLGILSALYLVTSAFLLISAFTGTGALRRLLLFSDSESKTMTTARVIKKLVVSEGKKIKGVFVKKVGILQDDKYGFKLKVTVAITGSDVEESVDTFRCMLADSFYYGLGVRFNSIDFVIKNLRPKYMADLDTSQKQAKLLKEKRDCSKQYIHEPLDEVYDEREEEGSGEENVGQEEKNEEETEIDIHEETD